MKRSKKFLVTIAAAALLTTGVASPALAVKPGGVTPQASGICDIFRWWPFGC